jgi:hypothetical protein
VTAVAAAEVDGPAAAAAAEVDGPAAAAAAEVDGPAAAAAAEVDGPAAAAAAEVDGPAAAAAAEVDGTAAAAAMAGTWPDVAGASCDTTTKSRAVSLACHESGINGNSDEEADLLWLEEVLDRLLGLQLPMLLFAGGALLVLPEVVLGLRLVKLETTLVTLAVGGGPLHCRQTRRLLSLATVPSIQASCLS